MTKIKPEYISNIYPSDFYMCEIVGNVFDTPEFLEAGEMP